MAFYKIDTGHFGLVLWSVSGGELQRSDLRTFKGGGERALLCGYCWLTERFLARNGKGATLNFGLQLVGIF